jgi:hypothetical protein
MIQGDIFFCTRGLNGFAMSQLERQKGLWDLRMLRSDIAKNGGFCQGQKPGAESKSTRSSSKEIAIKSPLADRMEDNL